MDKFKVVTVHTVGGATVRRERTILAETEARAAAKGVAEHRRFNHYPPVVRVSATLILPERQAWMDADGPDAA